MKVAYSTKIWISISILAVGMTLCSVTYLYLRSRSLVLAGMGGRLADVSRTAVQYFGPTEKQTLQRLNQVAQQKGGNLELITQGMSPGEYRESIASDDSAHIMQSDDFQSIVTILRQIKTNTRTLGLNSDGKVRKPAIRFATILVKVPGVGDKNVMRFLADADYDDPKLPNPFGNLFYGNSDALQWAFSGLTSADQDFRNEEGQYLLSAASPILDERGKPMAILALDYDAASEANAVQRLLYWSLAIVATSLALSLLLAVLISRMLNRPIEVLRKGAERVRNKDFNARVEVQSNDELGLLGSAFNAMVEEIQTYAKNLESVNTCYARFVPREFLSQLGQETITDVKLGDHVQKQMTVLFSDIRSFSTITEYMSPRDSFDFINDYLRAVSPVIRHHGGFIDKYIGDAIMALFPSGPESAVKAAIDMQKALDQLNAAGIEIERPKIEIGIGIHHGNLMLGTVGESERMDGTVISDAVNLASRLESLTKEYKAGIIVSERIVRALHEKDRIFSRYLGTVKVKGKQTAVEIYEIVSDENCDMTRHKIVSRHDFQSAVRALELDKINEARALLQRIVESNPADGTAGIMLERCQVPRKPKARPNGGKQQPNPQ